MQINRLEIIKRCFSLIAAWMVWVALGYQLHFFMMWADRHHFSTLGGLWGFFSFFTNLSNLLAGMLLLNAVFRFKTMQQARMVSLYTAALLYLCMTGIIFNLLLIQAAPKNGPIYLVNVLLHDVIPLLYALFWLWCVPRGNLGWQHVLWWLIFPCVYFAHVILRGWLIGHYPYAFFNVNLHGTATVALNGVGMLAGFVCLGGVWIVADGLKRR